MYSAGLSEWSEAVAAFLNFASSSTVKKAQED